MPPESLAPALLGGRAAAVGADPALAARWNAVHEAAAVVAALAAQPAGALDGRTRNFPDTMAQAGGQRLAVARQGIDDLAVILETGIRALLAVHARGASPLAAAQALRAEFGNARDALLALAPPEQHLLG